MELSEAVVSLAFLSLISLRILVSLLRRPGSNKTRRPPGPWRLPFIGNLLHLVTSQPHVALRDLAKKHGPVMYLRLGQVDTVVVSTPAAAQEVLRDKDLCFASRPSILAADIILYGSLDIASAPYGAYWRMLRKLCTVELLSTRKVRQLARVRDRETLSLVGNIRAGAGQGRPVNLTALLMSCSNAITTRAAFGHECGAELQAQFQSAMTVVLKCSGGLCVKDLFPSLWFVDVVTGLSRRLWRAHRQLDAVFEKIIAECEVRREEKKKKKKTMGDDDDEDLLSILLRMRDEGALEVPIDTTNIKAIMVDMFTAGSQTTSSTIDFIISELIRNPEVMEKAQAEVRRVFDKVSPQEHEAHMEKLCYTRMVIKEGMRLHPVLPLLVPHHCRETCEVGGFEVTEGSMVFVNAWAVARSPEHWKDAEEFVPERFTDMAADYGGSQFAYLPFGSGRRKCPGETFGVAVLELTVARLLYYFNWSLPGGMRPDELNMDMIFETSAKRKKPLHLLASPYHKLPAQV